MRSSVHLRSREGFLGEWYLSPEQFRVQVGEAIEECSKQEKYLCPGVEGRAPGNRENSRYFLMKCWGS